MKAPAKKHKKRGPPRTTGPGEQVVVRLHQPLLGAIDIWRSNQEDKPTRADAMRRLAALYLSLPVDVADQKGAARFLSMIEDSRGADRELARAEAIKWMAEQATKHKKPPRKNKVPRRPQTNDKIR